MSYLEEILKLSPDEKIDLVEKVWDSLSPEEITIPKSHVTETRRRLQAIRKGEVSFSSWEEVRKRIRQQL